MATGYRWWKDPATTMSTKATAPAVEVGQTIDRDTWVVTWTPVAWSAIIGNEWTVTGWTLDKAPSKWTWTSANMSNLTPDQQAELAATWSVTATASWWTWTWTWTWVWTWVWAWAWAWSTTSNEAFDYAKAVKDAASGIQWMLSPEVTAWLKSLTQMQENQTKIGEKWWGSQWMDFSAWAWGWGMMEWMAQSYQNMSIAQNEAYTAQQNLLKSKLIWSTAWTQAQQYMAANAWTLAQKSLSQLLMEAEIAWIRNLTDAEKERLTAWKQAELDIIKANKIENLAIIENQQNQLARSFDRALTDREEFNLRQDAKLRRLAASFWWWKADSLWTTAAVMYEAEKWQKAVDYLRLEYAEKDNALAINATWIISRYETNARAIQIQANTIIENKESELRQNIQDLVAQWETNASNLKKDQAVMINDYWKTYSSTLQNAQKLMQDQNQLLFDKQKWFAQETRLWDASMSEQSWFVYSNWKKLQNEDWTWMETATMQRNISDNDRMLMNSHGIIFENWEPKKDANWNTIRIKWGLSSIFGLNQTNQSFQEMLSGTWSWVVTQKFGTWHKAIDIDWKMGDPITSYVDWTAQVLKWPDFWNYVVVTDAQWNQHYYNHLNDVNVANWAKVKKWQLLWGMWNTWKSLKLDWTTPTPAELAAWVASHLDYRIKDTNWNWINPSTYTNSTITDVVPVQNAIDTAKDYSEFSKIMSGLWVEPNSTDMATATALFSQAQQWKWYSDEETAKAMELLPMHPMYQWRMTSNDEMNLIIGDIVRWYKAWKSNADILLWNLGPKWEPYKDVALNLMQLGTQIADDWFNYRKQIKLPMDMWNPVQAMSNVENAILKQSDRDFKDTILVKSLTQKLNEVSSLLKDVDPKYIGAFDALAFKFDVKTPFSATDAKSQKAVLLASKLTDIAKWIRNRYLGTAITETESAFLLSYLVDLTDQPETMQTKMDELKHQTLLEHNTSRNQFMLPSIWEAALLDANVRLNYYQTPKWTQQPFTPEQSKMFGSMQWMISGAQSQQELTDLKNANYMFDWTMFKLPKVKY